MCAKTARKYVGEIDHKCQETSKKFDAPHKYIFQTRLLDPEFIDSNTREDLFICKLN